jgi:hypothetical protein
LFPFVGRNKAARNSKICEKDWHTSLSMNMFPFLLGIYLRKEWLMSQLPK